MHWTMRPIAALLMLAAVLSGGAAALGPSPARAEETAWVCPAPGTVLYPELSGAALLDSLRLAFRPPVGLSYAEARNVMYSTFDNDGGRVTCVYTSYVVAVDPDGEDPKTEAFTNGINTEHTWPKSLGAEGLPREADMHHLFPTEIRANADRGNNPFAEIPDEDTDSWYRGLTVTATPLAEFIDEYSERDLSYPGTSYDGRWEPPEAMKGNIARAMFYFYTVYRSEADAEDPNFFQVQKNDLRAWHKVDPVDAREYARTCAIAPHQANRVNPFVIDSTLVDRAYFGQVPVRLLAFTAEPSAGGVRLLWETASETDHAGFHVYRTDDGWETRLTPALITSGPRYVFLDRSGRPGARYDYRLEALARDGTRERFGPQTAVYPAIAPALAIRPNPARVGETVRFDLEGAEPVAADLYDLAGRRVQSWRGAGELARGWDGRLASGAPAAPGVYFLRVETEEAVRSERLVLIR